MAYVAWAIVFAIWTPLFIISLQPWLETWRQRRMDKIEREVDRFLGSVIESQSA